MLNEDVDYLTVEEYAARMRVHVQTIYSAIRYGRFRLEVERIGRAIRIVVPRRSVSRESIKERMPAR